MEAAQTNIHRVSFEPITGVSEAKTNIARAK
jgi:hypothetical protein